MKRLVFASFLAGALLIVVAATAAVTHNDNGKSGKARLDSFQEVPMTLATTGRGSFRIRVRSDGLHYKLSYSDVESNVLFAHIHLGRTALNGGVIAFLCGGGDKPACPAREGTVEGVIDAADIVGPANQGIPAGDLSERAYRDLPRRRDPRPGQRQQGQAQRTRQGPRQGLTLQVLQNVRGGRQKPAPSFLSPTRSRSGRATRPGLPARPGRPSSWSA
jgi:CHRD domain